MPQGYSAAPTPEAGVSVFISYSRRDLAIADSLVEALEREGFKVTIDRRDLPYGEEWQKVLGEFIRQSDTVVWLVSPESVKSRWCNWELGEVRALNKRLIPIAIASVAPDDLPEAIGRIHLLPAEGVFDFTRHLPDLVLALNTDRAWIKEHTRLADRAGQWILRGRPGALLLRGSALQDAEVWRNARPPKAPPPSDDILELMLASRTAATRRQRQWIGGLASAAIGAFALAGFAGFQYLQAEASYGAARTTVDRLIIELATGMQNVERMPVTTINASLDVVKRLIGDLQEVRGGDDPLLKASRAAMFYQFAKTYQKAEDRKQALTASSESLILRRNLLSSDASRSDWRWDLVESLHLEGDLQRELKDFDAARLYYDEAVSHAEVLTAQFPGDPRYAISMSKGLVRLGDLDMGADRKANANERYERAFEIVATAIRSAPGEPVNDLIRELTWTYNKLGDVNLKLMNTPFALDAFERALCIRQEMAARAPQNTLLRADISFTHEKIGTAKLQSGDFAGAADAFMQAVILRAALYASDEKQTRWLRDLASARHLLATALLKAGDYDTARAFFLAAAWDRSELVRRQPGESAAAKAREDSMAGAREALKLKPQREPLQPEELWTEVVGREQQRAMETVQPLAAGAPCFRQIMADIRQRQS